MFKEETGDIFRQGATAIVNPVNCVGVMGAGLALQFKQRFRDIYKDYRFLCDEGNVRLGKTYWAATKRSNPTWVVMFPTKGHYSENSNLDEVRNGLLHLSGKIKAIGIDSIAIPRLGCGLGGLKWPIVLKTMKEILEDAAKECDIIIVSPGNFKK